ncbi:MAG: formylmethanofuran dehydrogenase subunit A [Planctomycetes bacterium]|nr:formylmethanofuran dehydrogenase subunit A [Planctomycetota bacterium]
MSRHDLLHIAGGTVYDPANGIDGALRDIWIAGGKIVNAPADPSVKPARTIDAAGMVVMPGGVDMHCHIAGPKVNAARRIYPEARGPDDAVRRTSCTRSGTAGPVPATFVTGYKYAGLGYTTAFDAAVPPLLARHAHMELADTPCIDKGCYILVGNNHYLMQAVKDRQPDKVRTFLAWLLGAARGYAPKLVNPGGVETWKQGAGNVSGLDDRVPHFDISPRQIIQAVAQAANELALPHPVHIHCNHLGLPGNWTTTLETMASLDGHRAHLAHIQFHSYGGGAGEETSFRSQVAPLAEYVNAHPDLTVDVGQVMFGKTITMTGDSAVGQFLHQVTKGKWLNCDVEQEAGCGIVPIRYRNKSLVHALQWAIGLEWHLLVDDPWQVVMSTDHPNGGSFLAYPEIIRLLMDRTYRADVLGQCPVEVRNRSLLADLDREYTLGEIAIITRAGPARILGLANKGQLGPGADADVTIYTPNTNPQAMFELPRLVIKAGEVLLENGEIRNTPNGKTLHVAPEYDADAADGIRDWFDENYTIQFANYTIRDDEFAPGQFAIS